MVSLVRPAAAYISTVLFQSRCCLTRRTALAFGSASAFVGAQQCSASSSLSSKNSKRTMTSSATTTQIDTGYLNAADAAALDGELMTSPGFTLEQLMELAGLSVAEAVYQVLQEDRNKSDSTRILLICGPGNNGGDSLVAARHLVMFGYAGRVTIVYPKRSSKQPHYANLVKQCEDVRIPVLESMPDDWQEYDCLVDSIFGFSFQGNPRPPFDAILDQLKVAAASPKKITVAVDIPSGWNVNGDDDSLTDKFMPDVLVSLTAPKLCAKKFAGRHFVGGRFLPPALAEKYNVRMPAYLGVSQVVEVTAMPSEATEADAHKTKNCNEAVEDWQADYAAYLAEEERAAANNQKAESEEEPEDESWEVQYAAYCAEKEAVLNQQISIREM